MISSASRSFFLLIIFWTILWIHSHAQDQPDSLLHQIQKLETELEKIDFIDQLLRDAAEQEFLIGDSILSIQRTLVDQNGTFDDQVKLAQRISYYYYNNYLDSLALETLQPLISKLNGVENPIIKAETFYTFGLANAVFGNYDITVQSFDSSLAIFETVGDSTIESFGDTYRESGATYMALGNFAQSALMLNKSLDLFAYNKDSAGMRGSLLDLCIVFSQIGLYDEAQKYMQERENYFQASTPPYEGLIGTINSGRVSILAEDWAAAIQKFSAVIDQAEGPPRLYLINGLIEALYFGNRRDSINHYFQELEETFDDLNRSEQFYFLYQQSRFLSHLSNGRFQAAEQDGLQLLQNSEEKGDVSEIMMHNRFLATLYEQTGDFENALIHTQQYVDTHDSIVAANKASALLVYQTLHETKEKESEIQRLNLSTALFQSQIAKDRLAKGLLIAGIGLILLVGWIIFNRFQERQREKIQEVRTNISSDLHDEVGSLLSGISMQAGMLEVLPEQKRSEFLSTIGHNVNRATQIMRDLVWSIDSRRDKINDLRDKISETCLELLAPSSFRYDIQLTGQNAGIKQLHPQTKKELYLICREALNNVIKHSNGSEVHIRIDQGIKEITLSIKDNGSFAQSKPSAGQGLDNIQKRAKSIDGKADIKKDETGFEVLITAPTK